MEVKGEIPRQASRQVKKLGSSGTQLKKRKNVKKKHHKNLRKGRMVHGWKKKDGGKLAAPGTFRDCSNGNRKNLLAESRRSSIRALYRLGG